MCHHFRDTSAPGEFFSHQVLPSITKLHRHRCPALEQDKFLLGAKTVQILQFARHDLKKKFLSAPTITNWKFGRQILSRFLDGPNKFCQSSASGPLVLNVWIYESRGEKIRYSSQFRKTEVLVANGSV